MGTVFNYVYASDTLFRFKMLFKNIFSNFPLIKFIDILSEAYQRLFNKMAQTQLIIV